jgi:hypothetical protein
MKQTYLPWFLLVCAIGLSTTAAYYSIIGLAVVFSGVAIPVTVMGSFLEVSKLAIATYLHNSWSKIYTMLKVYLTTALIVLSLITSIGIYGLLSGGFQQNIAKLEANGKRIENLQTKRKRYEENKRDYQTDKTTLNRDISALRNALSTSTVTITVDKSSGIVSRGELADNREAFESQLAQIKLQYDTIIHKIDVLNDSITALDMQVLDLQSRTEVSNELGVVQYIHELSGWSMKSIANAFILILIFVFDPLAIMLVIATNQAFEQLKPKLNIYGEPKPLEPEPTPQPPTVTNRPDIIQQIEQIEQSSATGKRKAAAIDELKRKLREDDSITY